MKKAFLVLPLAALLLFSCKEISPAVDFTPEDPGVAFIATVEPVEPRRVLIEEFTGVKCPPCPIGHQLIKTIEEDHPGRVSVIGIQPFNFGQANPVDKDGIKTKHDNRTQKGTDLINGIYGSLSQTPRAGIDRVSIDNSLFLDKEKWLQLVTERVAVPAPANIKILSTYIDSNRTVVIKVHIAYTATVAKKQRLNVAIIEDHVIDAQEDGLTVVENYEHQHVLRDLLTAPTGSGMLTAVPTKAAGQVYERTFIYDLAAADPSNLWNPNNCKIVAYVSNDEGTDKEVIQAAETDLK